MYLNRDDCDKYVFHMQKNHKSKGGAVWGIIKKKTVSMFILHTRFIQGVSNNYKSWELQIMSQSLLKVLTA